jgi:lysophospholipase L1-like esterase
MTHVEHPDIPEEPQMETKVDDALMDRFDRNSRLFRARDAILAVFVAAIVLVLLQGTSMTRAGDQLTGVQHDLVVAVGKPAGWIADRLPLHTAAAKLTKPLSPDEDLGDAGGFDQMAQAGAGGADGAGARVPPVTPDAFAPGAIGAKPPARRPLKTLLVTGDSLSTPLDKELARRLTDRGVSVKMEPHLGTGISKTALVDWGKLSAKQASEDRPDALVAFIGANEGWPMKGADGKDVPCCGADWASIYANRVRQVMNTYRRNGATHIYWLKVMTPRDAARQKIERVVNAAIDVAAQPWRSQIDVVDTITVFTPGERYRDSMDIGGKKTLVRESDGIHLNQAGAAFLADQLVRRMGARFTF